MNNALTPKQEGFCAFIVEGKDQTEAYRKAYKCTNAKPETVWSNASRLMADEKIQQRIEELRVPVIRKIKLTLESHLATLAELRDAAREKEQYSAAISAEVSRGRAAGFYVERVEMKNLSPEQREARVLKLLKTAKQRKQEQERESA